MALAICTQEILWTRNLLGELGVERLEPTVIYEDNQSAIATNVGYHSRANHIAIRHHFIRDHIASKTIELKCRPSKQQLADYLAKPLPTKQVDTLRYKSGVFSRAKPS